MKNVGDIYTCTSPNWLYNVGELVEIRTVMTAFNINLIEVLRLNSYQIGQIYESDFDKCFSLYQSNSTQVSGSNGYPAYKAGDQVKFNQDWICGCGQCSLTVLAGSVYEIETDYGNEVSIIYLPGARIPKKYFDLYSPTNRIVIPPSQAGAYRSYNPFPTATPGSVLISSSDGPVFTTGGDLGINSKCSNHRWKEYVGFTQRYSYCEICDEKQHND